MKRAFSCLFVLGVVACSAGTTDTGGSGPSGGNGGDTGTGATNTGGSPQGGMGGMGTFVTGSGGEGTGGQIINPCGTECGPTELCDGANKGIDDDCDGDVDEECACTAGQASSCFKGDPSYLNAEGCNPGTMHCTELGTWGPCEGGNHATDLCFSSDPQGCHPINAPPFATSDLSSGAGNFDDNADAGSETYTVTCPPGVMPCPTPNGTDYTALQSGEYEVTYTKEVNGVPAMCTFPLYIGARGLRVELSWNFQPVNAIDLDLHLKKPLSTLSWVTGGADQDCGYANCKGSSGGDFSDTGYNPSWFPNTNMVPDPVNWFLDPDFNQNGCYFAPRGEGDYWQDTGMGCHNPRLDADNISCNPSDTDPTSFSFCSPENINVDYPPKDEWMRIGVHYFTFTSNYTGLVTPTVKIFCDGALAAELGPEGFGNPPAPFTFNGPGDEDKMWLVADVLFHEDECVKQCVVEPLKVVGSDGPVVLTPAQWGTQNGPAYPPIPQ